MSETELEPVEGEEPEPTVPLEGDIPDDDDGDEDPAQPTEAPTEALEPASQDQIERMAKSLDLLQKHVAKRMGEILGEAATEYEECEICNYWNTPGWRLKGPLPSAVVDVVRVAIGEHALAEFKPDEFSRACDKCNGLGFVLTGSKVSGQESLPCFTCKGMGWLPIGNERASGAFATANGPAAQPPALAVVPGPAPPESPEIAAAKALLTNAGYVAVPPMTVTGA